MRPLVGGLRERRDFVRLDLDVKCLEIFPRMGMNSPYLFGNESPIYRISAVGYFLQGTCS